MSPIAPHQVTSNANSKLTRVALILEDRARPSADRMADITRLGEEYRAGVSGSTADPFREKPSQRLQEVYGPAHVVNNGQATREWLLAELGLIHAQRAKLERDLARAEQEAARARADLVKLRARKTPPRDRKKVEPGVTWEVRTALKGSGEPEWLVRSGHDTQEGADKEVASCGNYWRSQGLRVSVRRVEGETCSPE